MDFDLPEQANSARTLRPSSQNEGRLGSHSPQPPNTAGLEAYRRKLATSDAISPVYLDALRASTIPTVSFTLRGLPSPRPQLDRLTLRAIRPSHELQPRQHMRNAAAVEVAMRSLNNNKGYALDTLISAPPSAHSSAAAKLTKRESAKRRWHKVNNVIKLEASYLSNSRLPNELRLGTATGAPGGHVSLAREREHRLNGRERRQHEHRQLDRTLAAADAFDRRHRTYSAAAERCYRTLTRSAAIDAPEASDAFWNSIESVRWNRYVAPAREEMAANDDNYKRSAEAIVKRKEPFDLWRSIWRPRMKWADSKNLYDTDEVKQKRFEADWKRMLTLGIIKYIMRYDDDAMADIDEDGIPDEVEEVGVALLRNYDLCCAVFWYYASYSGEIDFMTFNAYGQLCTDCKLPSKKSKACRQSDIDTIFIAIDKSDALSVKKLADGTHDDGQEHREKALDRVEFMVAIMRIAIGKRCRAYVSHCSSHPRLTCTHFTHAFHHHPPNRQVHTLGGDGRRLRRAQSPAVGPPASAYRCGGAGTARRLSPEGSVHRGGVHHAKEVRAQAALLLRPREHPRRRQIWSSTLRRELARTDAAARSHRT